MTTTPRNHIETHSVTVRSANRSSGDPGSKRLRDRIDCDRVAILAAATARLGVRGVTVRFDEQRTPATDCGAPQSATAGEHP